MKDQNPKERIKNFNEVALGYTPEEAVREAARCLNCKKPICIQGCPVEIDIPAFITQIKQGNFDKAYQILREKNNLPAICGRVCPQETQCERVCVLAKKSRPVAIGNLERFASDWAISKGIGHAGRDRCSRHASGSREKIALIGSGPAGLTAAADLARMGYRPTIFESLHAPGGVLRYGIPEFRLPKKILDTEIGYLKELGVEVEINMVIGKIKTIEELRKDGFKAFFIGTGAGLPNFLGIEGENLNGVYSANEFLTRANLMKAYRFPEYDTPLNVGKRVAVIGAGNVAVDSARVAKRIGAKEVYVIYRRSEVEMPARLAEIKHAREEGIKFELLTNPIKIFGDNLGCVKKMTCVRNRLGEPDSSGRRRPLTIPGSEFDFDCDTVVVAIGQGPNPLLISAIPGLKLNKRGNVEADSDGCTSIDDIFAGGDIVSGAATVIEAMGAGKRAARAIDGFVKSQKNKGKRK